MWAEFCDSVGVRTLRELTQDHLLTFRDEIEDVANSPTYTKHRFGQIKTILRFPKKQGKWALDCDKALAFAAVLVPPSAVCLDPHPISREDWTELYTHSKGTVRAILLLALNACMYGSEVADTRWNDLNLDKGTLVARRNKTTVARIAMLWPETIEALRGVPRLTPFVFHTDATRMVHNANTATKAFRRLRKQLGLNHVKFCHLRDGAYTAAIQGNVEFQQAQMLAGHRVGIADHYILRRPDLVKDACEAFHFDDDHRV